MELSTVKYPSGREVSLASFLLKMTYLDRGEARRDTHNRGPSGVLHAGIPSANQQKEERR